MIQDGCPNPGQMNFLHADLLDQLNPLHALLRLANRIPWDYFDTEFSPMYSDQGRPDRHQTVPKNSRTPDQTRPSRRHPLTTYL